MYGSLLSELSELDHVELGDSMFGERSALWVNGTEIAHMDAGEVMDIRLTAPVIRQMRPQLKSNPSVSLRRSGSDWMEVEISSDDDVELVRSLVKRAVEEHAARAGEKPAPRPTGSELERRRRFH